MSPQFSWAQVWANLRPALLKLARRPVVWVCGLGLLALGALSLWAGAMAPGAAVPVSPAAPLPAGQVSSPDFMGTVGLAASITLKLAFVIALIYGCMYALKRWPGGWFAASKKRVALLETTRLSPRQALHLVQVGDRTLLVGATDQAVTLLTEVALPAAGEAAQPAAPAFTHALDQALQQPNFASLAPQGKSQL